MSSKFTKHNHVGQPNDTRCAGLLAHMRRFDVNTGLLRHTVLVKPLGGFRLRKPPTSAALQAWVDVTRKLGSRNRVQNTVKQPAPDPDMATAAPLLVKHHTAGMRWVVAHFTSGKSMEEVLGVGIDLIVFRHRLAHIRT